MVDFLFRRHLHHKENNSNLKTVKLPNPLPTFGTSAFFLTKVSNFDTTGYTESDKSTLRSNSINNFDNDKCDNKYDPEPAPIPDDYPVYLPSELPDRSKLPNFDPFPPQPGNPSNPSNPSQPSDTSDHSGPSISSSTISDDDKSERDDSQKASVGKTVGIAVGAIVGVGVY